jgi:hypothetical protein
VTIAASAKALVTVTGLMSNLAGTNGCFMGFQAGGVVVSDNQALSLQGADIKLANTAIQASATFLVTGLTTGSNTFTAKYRAGGSTCTFANRSIIVIPLP